MTPLPADEFESMRPETPRDLGLLEVAREIEEILNPAEKP
jgi:hypothetical protein